MRLHYNNTKDNWLSLILKDSCGLRPRPHVSGCFRIRNFFFPDTKISPSTRIRWYPDSLQYPRLLCTKNVFRACAVERGSGGKFAQFALHVVPPFWFIVRWETEHAFYVIGASSDKKITGFTRPHVIGFVADIFFSTLESGFIFLRIRCRIRRIRVDGSRIRKEKVADSKISGYVWTGPKTVGNLPTMFAWEC